MHILLIRHARHGVPARPLEGNLTEQGIRQAEVTGDSLSDWSVERLFTSPYLRSLQTALLISRKLRIPFEVRVDLHNKVRPRETTPTRAEIKRRYPEAILPGDMPEQWSPGEEDWRQVYARVGETARYLGSLEGLHQRVAVVTHAWPLDALISVLIGAPPASKMRFWYDNCSLTLISVENGEGRLNYLNDVSHLGPRELFFP